MRDGVRIAVDLYLPADLPPGTRVPAIVVQTRYARSFEVKPAYRFVLKHRFHRTIERFVDNGYAWIMVDARGSGASFGTRPYPYSPDEVKDGAEVLDWIVAQDWSNGRVGAWGSSYDGTAALFLATNHHPALKAIMPRFAFFDAYSEVVFPGGAHLRWLTDTWGSLARALDRDAIHEFAGFKALLALEGIRPVDDDGNQDQLWSAVSGHQDNGDVRDLVRGVVFRDDESSASPGLDLGDISPSEKLESLNRADVAPYLYTGWFDAAFLLSEIHLFMNLEHPARRLTIGPWDHGGWHNISPHAPGNRTHFDHDGEALRFFDPYLKERDTGIRREQPVHYYTMGEEQWKSADTWPPPGTSDIPFYLHPQGVLAPLLPEDEVGSDLYRVDLGAATGHRTRWDSLVNLDHKPIVYPNRKKRDRRLLVYDTSPLERDMEVTGHPVVTLFVTSSREDGNFFVYLEEVDQRGRVTYVTEGVLRALHHRLCDHDPAYRTPVPCRTFMKKDAAVLSREEVTKLVFDLYPTSYRFRKGHSIRLALAGADAHHFASPPGRAPEVRYHRNTSHPSHVILPVMPVEQEVR